MRGIRGIEIISISFSQSHLIIISHLTSIFPLFLFINLEPLDVNRIRSPPSQGNGLSISFEEMERICTRIGGPLLSIGDLLSDLADSETIIQQQSHHSSKSPPSPPLNPHLLHPSDLSTLFQLCATLDTAKNMIESTNSNVMVLSEKIGDLEKMIKKGDSAIAEVRSLHSSLSQRITSSSGSES